MEINEFNKILNEVNQEEQDNLTFEELFPDGFIKEYTKGRFNSYKEFFQSSGFKLGSQEDLDIISEVELNKLDEYIMEQTDFSG